MILSIQLLFFLLILFSLVILLLCLENLKLVFDTSFKFMEYQI